MNEVALLVKYTKENGCTIRNMDLANPFMWMAACEFRLATTALASTAYTSDLRFATVFMCVDTQGIGKPEFGTEKDFTNQHTMKLMRASLGTEKSMELEHSRSLINILF